MRVATRTTGSIRRTWSSSATGRAVKRYAAQLVQQEDRIDALHREVVDLERMQRQVTDDLAQLIERLAFDISLEG